MAKIAILYICTGKYVVFWKDFFDSYEENDHMYDNAELFENGYF